MACHWQECLSRPPGAWEGGAGRRLLRALDQEVGSPAGSVHHFLPVR